MFQLSKSDFVNGGKCLKRMHLTKHSSELGESPGPGLLARFATGRKLGEMARSLYPGGLLVSAPSSDFDRAISETNGLLGKHKPLFEAAVSGAGCIARIDILMPLADGWKIIEVKMGAASKDSYVLDAAFQVFVAQVAGLTVRRASILHLNKDFRRGNSEPEPGALFKETDVTSEAFELIPEIARVVPTMIAALNHPESPDVPINVHCLKDPCPFVPYCFSDASDEHVVYLPYVKQEQVASWVESGAGLISQLPTSDGLKPVQTKVWTALRNGGTYASPLLQASLESVVFPAAFVDFEAVSPAIPELPGTSPYSRIPFQWSLHVLRSEVGEPEHREYLHIPPGDPMADFSATLHEALADVKSIVFYSEYEIQTLRALVEYGHLPAAWSLQRFLDDGVDLLKIVRDHVYHREFRGSHSIKRVLPALCPGMSYEGLDIQDGEAAAAEYARMASPATTPAERDRIARALREYCRLDTLAMVEIYRALRSFS